MPGWLEWNKGLGYSMHVCEEMQRVLFDHLLADMLKVLKTLDLRLGPRQDKGGKAEDDADMVRPQSLWQNTQLD